MSDSQSDLHGIITTAGPPLHLHKGARGVRLRFAPSSPFHASRNLRHSTPLSTTFICLPRRMPHPTGSLSDVIPPLVSSSSDLPCPSTSRSRSLTAFASESQHEHEYRHSVSRSRSIAAHDQRKEDIRLRRNLKIDIDPPDSDHTRTLNREESSGNGNGSEDNEKPQGMGTSLGGFLTTSRSLNHSFKLNMNLFNFSRNTNTSTSSHKRTPSSTSSSSAPRSRRKSITDGPRPSFSRRSVSRHRRSREHRRKNSLYNMAIKPRIPGLYTPSLPPEIWAEILRFAGAFVDVDILPSPLASSLSSLSSSPSSPTPTSFLTYQQQHGHLSARIKQYNTNLKFKAGLTRVCRLFHWLAQEVLYHHVWIGKRKEGRLLAGRLCGDGGIGSAWGPNGDWGVSSVVSSGARKVKKDGKQKGKKGLFGWLGRRKTVGDEASPAIPPASATVPRTRTRTTSASSSSSVSPLNINVGHFIRRLHIETPSLDKCSPHDLLIILQYSTQLEEFFDYRSVQRPMHPLSLSASAVVPFSSFTSISSSSSAPKQFSAGHILTPDALLDTLFSRPLKRLSWTNYDHHPMDIGRGVRYYQDVVGPRLVLEGVGKGLEFLEISTSCSEVLFGNGGQVGWRGQEGVWGVGQGVVGFVGGSSTTPWRPSPASSPALGINSTMLTDLTASFTTTTTFTSLSTPPSTPSSTSPSIDGQLYSLVLPSLLSLKVTLDNATFTALATWDMPRLTHLSVMSADFGYADQGFRTFFEVHGWKILQLELGHSSEDIEEAWVTSRPSQTHLNAHPHGQASPSQTTNDGPFSIPLDQWCPGLHTFICSADAEWNWQSPDWIAPHVLLPTHAGLEVIGVRDMERRLKGDANDAARRRRADTGARMSSEGQEADGEDDPYFMLFEQFGSLLRQEAFPSLKHIWDMSRESDAIRKSGSISLLSTTSVPSASSAPSDAPHDPAHRQSSINVLTKPRKLTQAAHMARKDRELAREQGRRIMRFWAGVLEKCAERSVGLMNWRGEEVTFKCLGSLMNDL